MPRGSTWLRPYKAYADLVNSSINRNLNCKNGSNFGGCFRFGLFVFQGFGILGGGDAEVFFELAGEMVDGGVLEGSGDLGEVHFPLPDQGLAFL